MTHAYREIYLSNAQSVLGDAFDYAVNTCSINGNDFVNLFIVSSVSKRMENGEPACLTGKSGIEIAREVVLETKGQELQKAPQERFGRSKEYWIGWAVAYYQWASGRRYSEIFSVNTFEDLQKMYDTLHEADVTKFADIVNVRMKEYYFETNLKRIRTIYGLTQAELAERAGVTLRSIQMYEQRNKNINKASVDTVYKLAKTLGCTIEDLIEK
ncbi:MAG: helix-turn-helix transcriptional regulator [Emergencia sp.]|jgi:DNA-binding XRE family transcriptional regulator|uniref:XRE family transcriptional regulator n=1 Tax=Anaerotruncus colihominis TaxID=169435 RepID=A0A845QKV8_9FIRM|nr:MULTISPECIES: helix-turn-helix transcriptional regulator [Anaerotruncus]MCI9474859.1 helix-turn-helix transcriptional regulator [Emergencia sp.]NBH62852.1 XRE family transcriptional regulator [Anaerotruncus colihominis]NCF03506.1 XRE family transcriptional regulator [Anaerotruncus sp. 80]